LFADGVHRPAGQDAPAPVRRRPFRGGRRSALSLRRIVVVLVVEVAALASVITCVAALIRNDSPLGVAAGVVGCALVVAVWFLSRPPPGGRNRSRSAAAG
jgi:hypothetical protein